MPPTIISIVQPDQMVAVFGILAVVSIGSLLLAVVVCGCCSSKNEPANDGRLNHPAPAVQEVPLQEPTGSKEQPPLEPPPLAPTAQSLQSMKSTITAPATASEPEQLPSVDQAVSFQLMEYREQSIGLLPGKATTADLNAMPSLRLMETQPIASQQLQPRPPNDSRFATPSQTMDAAVISANVQTRPASRREEKPTPSLPSSTTAAKKGVSGSGAAARSDKHVGSTPSVTSVSVVPSPPVPSRPKEESKLVKKQDSPAKPSRQKKKGSKSPRQKRKKSESPVQERKRAASKPARQKKRLPKGAPTQRSASNSVGNTSDSE